MLNYFEDFISVNYCQADYFDSINGIYVVTASAAPVQVINFVLTSINNLSFALTSVNQLNFTLQ